MGHENLGMRNRESKNKRGSTTRVDMLYRIRTNIYDNGFQFPAQLLSHM